MKTGLINAMVASATLLSLPAIGSAATQPSLQGCMRAFEQQLTAGATKPMKIIEGREVDSSTPAMLFSQPEYVLTARDALSDRTIARVVCVTGKYGQILLLDDRLP